MSEKKTGGPAFPQSGFEDQSANKNFTSEECGGSGLTVRDYFAAKAMQSMSAGEWPNMGTYQEIAKRAYVMADAMLKAREA